MAQATSSAELLAFITATVALKAESVISEAAIAIRVLPIIFCLLQAGLDRLGRDSYGRSRQRHPEGGLE